MGRRWPIGVGRRQGNYSHKSRKELALIRLCCQPDWGMCRGCCRPGRWAGQAAGPDRAISRSLAARRRLGCTDTNTLELPFCPKPKWMRWWTYERQMAVIRESRAELLGMLEAR